MSTKEDFQQGIVTILEERDRLMNKLGLSSDEALRILELACNYTKADELDSIASAIYNKELTLTVYSYKM